MCNCSEPLWVQDERLTEKERQSARLEWQVRSLALKISRTGSITTLSEFIGVTHTVFYVAMRVGTFTPEMAIKLENRFGKELAPREVFCPLLG